MNVFEFNGQVRRGIATMRKARAMFLKLTGYADRGAQAEVFVRLKDGTELPVTAVKVRGSDRLILETFVDEKI